MKCSHGGEKQNKKRRRIRNIAIRGREVDNYFCVESDPVVVMTAEESEKKFQKIMDKLYHSPRTKPTPPPKGGVSRMTQKGKCADLRVGMGSKSLFQSQACRPWDREDLTRRLSTFKAMTWFGKPKSISPLTCARRGWVNVDMDTIACEACGSRLLFSSPSSWSFSQVEKAASVFSLKLDNGHKLLCPWTDNICDASLANFPALPAKALVESFKERASALLQLSALPVISSTAVNYMMSPQLEHLLKKSPSMPFSVDSTIKFSNKAISMQVEFTSEVSCAILYFQAQKLISLCGWELRLLPYSVDSEDRSNEKPKSSSGPILGKNHATLIYSSDSPKGTTDGEKENEELQGNHCDPQSAVLDCKFCGACVGLWTFKSIPRPLELFSLSELPDFYNQSGVNHVNGCPALPDNNISDAEDENRNLMRRQDSVGLTIGGGLPPSKQNFRPRISLPIISRHLRAEMGAKEKEKSIHQSKCPDMSEHEDVSIECGIVLETLKRKRTGIESSDLNKKGSADEVNLSSGDNNLKCLLDIGKENSSGDEIVSQGTDEGRLLVSDATISVSETHTNGTATEPTNKHFENTGKTFLLTQRDMDEFDPIRQHRPFCPWIDGDGMPGYKMVLLALDQEGDLSPGFLKETPPPRLEDELDDPIVSVRRLFQSHC